MQLVYLFSSPLLCAKVIITLLLCPPTYLLLLLIEFIRTVCTINFNSLILLNLFYQFYFTIFHLLILYYEFYFINIILFSRMKERWIPYPFQNNICSLPLEDQVNCINGLIGTYVTYVMLYI